MIRIAQVNRHADAVQAGLVQPLAGQGDLLRVGIDGHDVQLRAASQFQGQVAVAAAQIDAVPLADAAAANDLFGGGGDRRICRDGGRLRTMHDGFDRPRQPQNSGSRRWRC